MAAKIRHASSASDVDAKSATDNVARTPPRLMLVLALVTFWERRKMGLVSLTFVKIPLCTLYYMMYCYVWYILYDIA